MYVGYISQFHGNANKKTKKWMCFIQGVMKKKSGKELKIIETCCKEVESE